MSHQVLARTWRPRDFASLVGQEHVVRALTHALDHGRLHHAYLFTGTRGVGKTSVARILARALNCETGVSSTPCGRCGACVAIEQGRFPDYIEMDAASNRGVDEMAQLLEQVVYAPVAGRSKVYMIDEVHMLSGHAFNAMLKTLEEPPQHVTFILATTDPKKVPVTVLSRCLQFNLRQLPPGLIAGHLAQVLTAESVPFEPPALAQLGRAAAGSMRDALSLLDQAIAYGGGRVEAAAVREMLGAVDRRDLERVLEALHANDGPALFAVADDLLAASAPFERTLLDLAQLLTRIALVQAGAPADDEPDDAAARWATRLAAEDLQVWYQVAIHGVRDLPLAPDPHAGFSMTLLRMLAFRGDDAGRGAAASAAAGGPARAAEARRVAAAAPAAAPGPAPARARPAERAPAAAVAATAAAPRAGGGPGPGFDGDWPALAAAITARMEKPGLVGQFMQQSELLAHDAHGVRVRVPVRPLAEPALLAKVREQLATHFGRPIAVEVEVGTVLGTTASAVRSRERADAQAQAQATLEGDAFVQTLVTGFGGTILPESIEPIGPNGESR
jgi:DNA polymerase-3 subunit gamma/tau